MGSRKGWLKREKAISGLSFFTKIYKYLEAYQNEDALDYYLSLVSM